MWVGSLIIHLLAQKISFHLFVCSRSDKPIPSLAHLFSSLCIVLEILILSNFCNQSFWSFSRNISKQAAIIGVKASNSLRGRQQALVHNPARNPIPLLATPHSSLCRNQAEMSTSSEPETPHLYCRQDSLHSHRHLNKHLYCVEKQAKTY